IAEGGAGLDRQLIKREVRAGESQRFVEFVFPGGGALPGAGIYQVEGGAREDVASERDCGNRLVAIVTAAEKPQRRRIERLHTERQAIHPGRGKPRKALRLRRVR